MNTNQKRHAYLDWVNNFVTTSAFARHYGITMEKAYELIHEGRLAHEASLNAPQSEDLVNSLLGGPTIAEIAVQCEASDGKVGTFLRGITSRKTLSPVFPGLVQLFQWIHGQENIHEVHAARKYLIEEN